MTFHAYSLLICLKEEKEKKKKREKNLTQHNLPFLQFKCLMVRKICSVTERVLLSAKMTTTVEGTYNYAPTFDHVDCGGDHVIVSIEV